ncbi:helix-turn-helix transcriptional regulator [Bacillus sp. FJAT-49705]|uniref:Helix-turn-helix transcriptional regulator n=1 Tax=Cytobacillus citreus TaxID=2833586 RepID=A0ABS5P0R0_9BACI|nr:LuxR C-terminal-related transcriptional regulator [Cytobacillus citreus]MBS4192814.1 helix-turn-helix transcriptional regulator [Cytobacillus citreus]
MLISAIKEQIHSIKSVRSHDEKQILAVRGFMDLFHFSRVGLYFYSTLSKIGEGILRIDKQGISSLREWREDVRNMPPIYSAIQERKPKHVDSLMIQQLPEKYTKGMKTEILVVPLSHGSHVVGYACMGSTDSFTVRDSLLHSLDVYGQHLGQIFGEDDYSLDPKRLSRREIEVLQKMSWGNSTKEMAVSLGISEFTVQDYVRSAIRKLEVLNRVQGVAEALRRGIIQ